jgi:two-component system, NtrC family, nitrogen regulation response regulator GlnG
MAAPCSSTTRLLRVLAEGEFFRVGGRELISVDVRVIAATHQDLETLVAQGRFRADLLHRLDVVRLRLPPLRERREDIPALAQRFLGAATAQLGSSVKRFEKSAMARLQAYDWPGNVRELENLCWRLAALAPGETIQAGDLQQALNGGTASYAPRGEGGDWEALLRDWAARELANGGDGLYDRAHERFERVLMQAALEASSGHRQLAAKRLGLGRNTLTRKLGSSRQRSR